MLDREILVWLDDVAARLLRLADERTGVGNQHAERTASIHANAVVALLDYDGLRQAEIRPPRFAQAPSRSPSSRL